MTKSIVWMSIALLVVANNVNDCVAGIFDFLSRDTSNLDAARETITFTNEDLVQAVNLAQSSYDRMKTQEESILNSPIQLNSNSTSYAQYLESLPNNKSKEFDKVAQIVLRASKYLLNNNCRRIGTDDQDCADVIATYKLPESDLLDQCEALHESKDEAVNVYRRLLPANYLDGLSKMMELPPPKNISDGFYELTRPDLDLIANKSATFEGVVDAERNVALVQWSQFIEHDLVKTAFQTMSNGSPIECCTQDATNAPPRYRHPACAALIASVSDDDYIRLPSCLNYVRSAIDVNVGCKFGPAQQINQASNLLDLSQLYGNTRTVTDMLRTFNDGEMRISNDPATPTLPEIQDISTNPLCMHNTTIDTVCYESGDSRVNVNPYVTTLYTIFLRSHNRLAKELAKKQPTLNDDQLFKLARRINVGIYQKIIYEEWLHVVLGNDDAKLLNARRDHCNANESVSNEFATAGIRFYYSMMPGDLKTSKDVSYFLRQKNIVIRPMTEENILRLKDEFYKPRDLSEDDELENIVDAVLKQKAMAMDTGYVADVAKYYYRFQNTEQKAVGTDVLALDILRGRDHGLNSYTHYLELCTNRHISNWTDLQPFINDEDLERLQAIYTDFDQIDLIVGAIAEKPKPGATVGETFSCIIGEQLLNTRCSDKQFYTSADDEMVKEIVDKYSGAKLICDNTKLTSVPTNIFHSPSQSNRMLFCSDLL